MIIQLVAGAHPDAKYRVPRERLDVPVTADHPVVVQLQEDPDRLAVSARSRGRAIVLVHTLIREWERRGHAVELPEGERGFTMVIGDLRFLVQMSEELEVVERMPSVDELAGRATYSWQRVQPEECVVPSGRLVVELPADGRRRRRRWADRERWSLEDKLPEVLAELQARARAEQERRLARARERQYRRQQWEAAMAKARNRFAEDTRVRMLREQVAAWDDARRIRGYCDALEAKLTSEDPVRGRVLEWIGWARGYADRVDPLAGPVRPPEIPEPQPHELSRYLGHWSPYGPDGR